MRRAFSYIRISDRRQMASDRLCRQFKLTQNSCARKGLFLDESLRLDHLGVSGFRGKNADVGGRSEFLEAVKDGLVAASGVLVIKNSIASPAATWTRRLLLFMGILKAGVSIATISLERNTARAAAVQLYFRGGRQRSSLIICNGAVHARCPLRGDVGLPRRVTPQTGRSTLRR